MWYKLNEDKTTTKVDKIEDATFSEPNRRVGYDKIGNTTISTVFLAIDHNYSRVGDPILFETMIFTEEIPDLNDYQKRYTTWDIADKAHKKIVDYIKNLKK